jgi:hypothetical protein
MESDGERVELEERHADLASRLAAKHKERDRWLHLYAQGHISEGKLELHLADVGTQLDNLKLLLSSVESDLATKHEEVGLAESSEAWLLTLKSRLSEVEEDTEEAFEKRRQLVKLLVAGITAGKNEDGRPDVQITYRFGPPEPAPVEDMFVHGLHSSTAEVCREARGAGFRRGAFVGCPHEPSPIPWSVPLVQSSYLSFIEV